MCNLAEAIDCITDFEAVLFCRRTLGEVVYTNERDVLGLLLAT